VVLMKYTTICVLLCLLFSGCSLFQRSEEGEELTLLVFIEKNNYLPNESLLLTLRLENLTDETITTYNFDARSVLFYLMNKATGEPLEVMPVYSEKEPLLIVKELEPYEKMERKFLFTTITTEPGEFALQVSYRCSALKGEEARANLISRPAEFKVSGKPPYQRDKKGILKKQDAIEIAKVRLDKPVKDTWAKLVVNEAGFYDWWVTLVLEGETDLQGNPLQKAYFVNPYLASVRRDAKPFLKPVEEEDKPVVPYKKRDKFSEGLNLNPVVPVPEKAEKE